MADSASADEKIRVDILIGLDLYWKLMRPQSVRQIGGLVAQESAFGWILSGSFPNHSGSSTGEASPQLMCLEEVPETELRRFWDLESIGISTAPLEMDSTDPELDPVFKNFSDTVQRSPDMPDGLYEVGLPWKPDDVKS
jgi:hypothetical protein